MKLQSGQRKQAIEYTTFTLSNGDKCYEKAERGGKRVAVGIGYSFRGVNLGATLITLLFY